MWEHRGQGLQPQRQQKLLLEEDRNILHITMVFGPSKFDLQNFIPGHLSFSRWVFMIITQLTFIEDTHTQNRCKVNTTNPWQIDG